MSKKIYVIYHKDCLDGYTAAWAAHKYLTPWAEQNVTYIPLNYSASIPNFESKSLIYILDFSFKPEVISKLLNEHTVILLDHHKSSMEAWSDYITKNPQTTSSSSVIRFDMTKSGARLAWEYFNKEPIPDLVKYVEDRDLWRFAYPQSKAFHSFLTSFPMTFEDWDRINKGLENDSSRNEIFMQAGALMRQREEEIKKIVEDVKLKTIGRHNVPVINCPYFLASEACNLLLDTYENAPFVASYHDRKDFRQWSLRSKSFDVSEIAALYGGGGHKQASGYEEFYG